MTEGEEPESATERGDDRSEDQPPASESVDRETLREQVEAEYDFDRFSPADMAEMSAAEWEAVFDPDTWVTGEALLERVEADLTNRVAGGELFAAVERRTIDGESTVVAYAERDYAVVYPDGSVGGRGTVLRDVKPAVALCSMPDYEVPDPPAGNVLPAPEDIGADTGELGNRMLQVIAAVFFVAGAVLLGAVVIADLGSAFIIATTGGVLFLGFALFLLVVVANARLSQRYRAAEFRDRLAGIRAIQAGETPFPTEGEDLPGPRADDAESRSDGAGGQVGDARPDETGGPSDERRGTNGPNEDSPASEE